ncbi:hypothetical protein M595_6045 [Lyngbya aestuarii BL J]|uniref:Uncharacterized protein n=1 Tax=Lyngbya aestuarii BL J TaxID=1348334 RepID=U7Q856_9CYAN|nr:hypothetical protein M595_6045 [Lyngbya aestuarii BL J]
MLSEGVEVEFHGVNWSGSLELVFYFSCIGVSFLILTSPPTPLLRGEGND